MMKRRHDLDALRAVAMLLGVVLHSLMSFMGLSPIRDSQQASWVWGVFLAIHGFRMPLFFLVSGYFTLMLWQKRGLQSMLRQRSIRILLPCLVGVMTIVPLDTLVGGWALQYSNQQRVQKKENRLSGDAAKNIFQVIRFGDFSTVKTFLSSKKKEVALQLKARDPEFGMPPLHLAALLGRTNVATILLEKGADIQQRDEGGRTALHAAAFLGRARLVEVLLDRKIDVTVRGDEDDTALDATNVPWDETQGIATWLGVPEIDRKTVEAGRKKVRELLQEAVGSVTRVPDSKERKMKEESLHVRAHSFTSRVEHVRKLYASVLKSDVFTVGGVAKGSEPSKLAAVFENLRPRQLFMSRVFDHLWFLWFLCWLIALFVLNAATLHVLGIHVAHYKFFQLKRCLLWMIPLTLIPQLFMGVFTPRMHFGPDLSFGVLPQPHLVLYYALFFGFGMSVYASGESAKHLGRWWPLHFTLAAICFPIALVTMSNPVATAIPQVLFAWLTCIGFVGFFHRYFSGESKMLRYISDASYWLYLMHIPFVMVIACLIQSWQWPVFMKVLLICSATTAILLLSYQLFVRYTWIGIVLHGPRQKMHMKPMTD